MNDYPLDKILDTFGHELILNSMDAPTIDPEMSKYTSDPVGFCEDNFNEVYTDDAKAILESVRDNVITIAKSSNATGKSQPIDTPIIVPSGTRAIGTLRVGSIVFGQDGKKTKVIGVYPQGKQPTYKITFNDKEHTFCSEDHLWNVITSTGKHRKEKFKTVTTSYLIHRIKQCLHVPMCKPVEFDKKVLPVDPYVLGALIGDGTLGQSVRFDSGDQFIIDEIDKRTPGAIVKKYKNKSTHYGIVTERGKTNPILISLESLGLIGKSSSQKFIPKEYLLSSVEQRKLLLKGLMDTDGYIDKRHSFSFVTISKRLSVDFQNLVWSLGGTAKISTKYPTFTHNGEKRTGQRAYIIHMKLPSCPFLLPRKVKRYVPEQGLQKQAQRMIKKVKFVGFMESVCIEVDNKDGLYLTEKFIVTHNTHIAARASTWFYKCHQGAQVYTAAAPPKENLENILWGEIGYLLKTYPSLFENDTWKNLSIQRNPLEFIKGVAIPSSGTSKEREARFCAYEKDLFELTNGEIVEYRSLIGETVDCFSVGKDFSINKSKAEFFDNGNQDVYELILSSGYKAIRTSEHPFYTGKISQCFKTYGGTHKKGRYKISNKKWRDTKDLKKGDSILCPSDTSFNFGSNKVPDNEIKVLAYLIGDGCISDGKRVLFFQEENKQLEEFKKIVTDLGGELGEYNKKKYSIKVTGDGSCNKGSNPIINILNDHDAFKTDSSNKRIPRSINRSTRESISLFLNRLYSTDGWACLSKTGKYQKAEIGYCSKNEMLVRDIQRLLLRFGIQSKVNKKKTSWTYNNIKKFGFAWNCVINRAKDIILFSNEIGIYGKEKQLIVCKNFSESRCEYAAWREDAIDGLCWDKVKSIRYIGKRKTVGVNVPGDNTYITGLVEHNSGKHAPYMLFVFDEGDAIPDEVYSGTESCMTGGHVRLLIMFNPRGSSGTPYRMEKNKTANIVKLTAFNHPNVLTGVEKIPGAVTREVTVRRINEWARPLMEDEVFSPYSCFILPDFLVGAQASRTGDNKLYPPLQAGEYKIINAAFSYMVLGEYPAQSESQLISEEWIDQARLRYDQYVATYGEVPPKGVKGIMGLDVAEQGLDKNCAARRYGGFIPPLKKWEGVDPTVTARKAANLYSGYGDLSSANVDGTGVGAGVAQGMQDYNEDVVSFSVKVASSPTETTDIGDFKILRDQIYWMFREWLRTDNTAMLPPDEALIEQALVVTYSTDDGYVRIMKKPDMKKLLHCSPDELESVILTFAPKSFSQFLDLS